MLIWFEIHFKLDVNKEFTCDTTYDYFIFNTYIFLAIQFYIKKHLGETRKNKIDIIILHFLKLNRIKKPIALWLNHTI